MVFVTNAVMMAVMIGMIVRVDRVGTIAIVTMMDTTHMEVVRALVVVVIGQEVCLLVEVLRYGKSDDGMQLNDMIITICHWCTGVFYWFTWLPLQVILCLTASRPGLVMRDFSLCIIALSTMIPTSGDVDFFGFVLCDLFT